MSKENIEKNDFFEKDSFISSLFTNYFTNSAFLIYNKCDEKMKSK